MAYSVGGSEARPFQTEDAGIGRRRRLHLAIGRRRFISREGDGPNAAQDRRRFARFAAGDGMSSAIKVVNDGGAITQVQNQLGVVHARD